MSLDFLIGNCPKLWVIKIVALFDIRSLIGEYIKIKYKIKFSCTVNNVKKLKKLGRHQCL